MDLPNPGIKLESPALQVDSLPTELSGKPLISGTSFQELGEGEMSSCLMGTEFRFLKLKKVLENMHNNMYVFNTTELYS